MNNPDTITPPLPVAGQPLRLGVLYNSKSGRHRRRWRASRLGPDTAIHEANNPAEIGPALRQLDAQGVQLLAVAGGDGTVQSVLTHLMLGHAFKRMPLLALVPTGSTNMTASDVGSVHGHRDGWERLVAWAASPQNIANHVSNTPVMRIQHADNDPFCGMFLGAGAVHHAVSHTQRNLHGIGLRGDLGPGLTFARFVKSVATGDRRLFAPVTMQMRDSQGRSLDTDGLLLLISTLNRLLLHFRPFWNTTDAGPLRYTVVENGAEAFLRRIPAVCRGNGRQLTPERGYHSHRTERLELTFDGGYIVDGEFHAARAAEGPVTITSAGDAAFVSV